LGILAADQHPDAADFGVADAQAGSRCPRGTMQRNNSPVMDVHLAASIRESFFRTPAPDSTAAMDTSPGL
jgi:hypothetical protein